MWMSRWVEGVKSRWSALVKSGCLLPVVVVASCVGVCQYDMRRDQQRKEEELARQRASDPCHYDEGFRRAHPELDALSARQTREMVQWSAQGELDELELKADEIKNRLREPEVLGQRAIQRAELAGKMAERRIAQLDALLKKHDIEWKAACEAAIAKSR